MPNNIIMFWYSKCRQRFLAPSISIHRHSLHPCSILITLSGICLYLRAHARFLSYVDRTVSWEFGVEACKTFALLCLVRSKIYKKCPHAIITLLIYISLSVICNLPMQCLAALYSSRQLTFSSVSRFRFLSRTEQQLWRNKSGRTACFWWTYVSESNTCHSMLSTAISFLIQLYKP